MTDLATNTPKTVRPKEGFTPKPPGPDGLPVFSASDSEESEDETEFSLPQRGKRLRFKTPEREVTEPR